SHVGTGFDERTLEAVKSRLEPLARKTNPFEEEPERSAPTTWVEPKLVAEVNFHSWTEDGHLRAPVFARLRDDLDVKKVKKAKGDGAAVRPLGPRLRVDGKRGGANDEVVAQLDGAKKDFTLMVEGHQIKITHLDRVYWPADPSLKQPAL